MKISKTLFYFAIIYGSVTTVNAKPITIATFNCEFLTTPKVHIKYGLPFSIKKAKKSEQVQWEKTNFRKNKYLESAKEVAKVIKSINADIISLTEVGDESDIKILVKQIKALGLDYKHTAIGTSKDTITKQNVAVLSKFPLVNLISPIPGRESYLQELDDSDTEASTGVSKGLRVTAKVNDKNIIIYSLHFSSERGGHEKDMQRIAQASIVRRHMLPSLINNEMIIVAGDLNEKRGQPTLLRIRGFDDIYPDLIQTGLAKYFKSSKLDTRWTYSYMGIRQQIDHILLSDEIKLKTKRSGIKSKTITHNNKKASDHKPFIITINFKD